MSDKMKIGLIGCGSQGRYLSEAAAATGQAELLACADLKPEAASNAVKLTGYQEAYDSAEELLDKADVDAVIVATIHDQLQPMAMAAIQAGKHVLVEKPMALNAADGQALVDAAKKAKRNLMVGYSLRFQAERIRVKQLLDQGAVGDMAHVIAGQCIGNMGGWLGQRGHGGGPLLYVGVHCLDFVLWTVGLPVQRVFAEVNMKDGEDTDVEADAMFTIRFDGGVVAQVVTSQRMGGRYGWYDAIGSAGRVRTEWESPNIFVESRNLPEYSLPTTIEVPATYGHPPHEREAVSRLNSYKYIRTWAAELSEFITSIREARPPLVSGEDGVRVLQVCDAVFASADSGQTVG